MGYANQDLIAWVYYNDYNYNYHKKSSFYSLSANSWSRAFLTTLCASSHGLNSNNNKAVGSSSINSHKHLYDVGTIILI